MFFSIVGLLSIAISQTIVNINTIPREVTVFLDDIELGDSPINTTIIDTGKHSLRFEKKRFVTSSTEIMIAPSKLLDIQVRLVPLHSVLFMAEDEGLVFEWDESYKWTHKKISFDMQEGTHVLKVFRNRELVDKQRIKITRPQTIGYRLSIDSTYVDH